MGKTPARAERSYWGGDCKWISIADIKENELYISSTKECITKDAVRDSGIKPIPPGTLIMSFKLSIGRVAVTTSAMFSNEAIMAFLPKIDSPEFDIHYLYHQFKFKNWTPGTRKAVMGATLNKATLLNADFLYHDIATQRKIAAELDQICELKKKAEQLKAKLQQLVKSKFIEMFGDVTVNDRDWNITRFDQVTTSRLGKMLDAKKQTGLYTQKYLANFNVQWFRFDLAELHSMDFTKDDMEEFALKDGDLLVCEGGESGRCCIWRNQIDNCFYQKALHRVRCDYTKLVPEYLSYWFWFICSNHALDKFIGAKSTIQHLPGIKLKSLTLPLPPLPLQQQFAAFVEKVEKQETAADQLIDKLGQLYRSKLQEYFA